MNSRKPADGRNAFTLAVLVLLAAVIATIPASASNCTVAALTALNVPNVTITSATDVAAAPPQPEYCDVKGSVATSGFGAGPGSAGFESKLPTNWNGKFLFNGVGGLAGNLGSSANPVDQALFLVKGYATGVTDTGHLNTNPTWEYTSPGVPNTPAITDYFYRAVHEATVATKALTKAYYNAPRITRSYFDGCSNGGKMGFEEATRFPNDYDGIVAGAPWLDPLGTELWALKNTKALLNDYIPTSLYPAIESAVTAQCDAVDGVVDGLIQDPAKCSFDPDSLVPGTLTQGQADALKGIVKPVRAQDGDLIYPGTSYSNLGTQLGSYERSTPPTDPTGAHPWGTLSVPGGWNLGIGIILSLGYYDQSVDLNNAVENNGVVFESARKLLYHNLAGDIPDDPSRLHHFLHKGGKIIIYHGYSDNTISPYRSIWYYQDLAERLGGYHETQEHVRLFMVPGMHHCTGGSFPNAFDTLTALENWVENGVAPDSIIASHTTSNVVDRTMPLCKYPEQARYNGSGDVNNAANWTCPPHDRSLLQVGRNGRQAGLTGDLDDDRDHEPDHHHHHDH
jgi:feruloyl esterase